MSIDAVPLFVAAAMVLSLTSGMKVRPHKGFIRRRRESSSHHRSAKQHSLEKALEGATVGVGIVVPRHRKTTQLRDTGGAGGSQMRAKHARCMQDAVAVSHIEYG